MTVSLHEERSSIVPYGARTMSPLDDYVAIRSKDYPIADRAQGDRRVHHVGWIALHSCAHHGKSIEVSS